MLQRKWLDYPKPSAAYPGASTDNADEGSCRQLIDQFAARLPPNIDVVAGIDTGGGVLAGALAMHAKTGFVVVRKIDSLAVDLLRNLENSYHLGDGLVIARGLNLTGKTIVLIDDVLVSGNTGIAAASLLVRLGASVRQALYTFEIDGQGGRQKLEAVGLSVTSLAVLPAPTDPSRLDEALAYTAPYRYSQ
ncbi:MAG: phosphoribosyltransferase family protein [Bosea sp. (in: a-proteobacteria)]